MSVAATAATDTGVTLLFTTTHDFQLPLCFAKTNGTFDSCAEIDGWSEGVHRLIVLVG